jgi:hypothetical protein
MAEMRNAYKIFLGKSEGKRPLVDLEVDGSILKWILKEKNGKTRTKFICLSIRLKGRLFEQGNESSNLLKADNFLTRPSAMVLV